MNQEALKIRTLTERFLDGETTLDEERQLYELYGRGDVPADLLPLRQMFLDYAALPTPEAPQAETPAWTARTVHRRHWRWAVAAAVAVLLVGGALTMVQQQQANECVAYVYGQRVTDRQQVLAEMRQSLATIATDGEDDVVDAQLRDLFSGE